MKFYQKWTAVGNDGVEFPAEVPGNVQWDYAQAMGWGDIQYGDTVHKFLEIEPWQWVYRTQLQFKAEPGERVYFVAEGIDYEFDILLNGTVIFSQEGMYTPVELDITDSARPADVLQVRIHPRPWREDAPVEPYMARSAADRSCKPPVTYGWDWNPRLVNSGIWQDAYVQTRTQNFIRSCEPFYTLNESRTAAQVRFETDCDADVVYTVSDPDGKVIYRGSEAAFTVENVRLWWCNGHGEAALYTWKAETADHSREGTIGFRTVKLVRNIGADIPEEFPKPRYAAPITLELNGRRIFAKGSNMVNPGLFFGRYNRQTYEELVELAQNCNMNMLRIWGGAGICKQVFYDLCDRAGILVWQEFMLACNNYVGTPEYLSVLNREATSIIKQLRCHPSIAFWCGGNELFNSWSGMDDQSPALRLLNKLCYELDPERAFMMTAPLEGMGHGSYMFVNPPDNKDVFQRFNNSRCTAYSEFGVPSLSPEENLRRAIPEEELYPIEDTPSWRAHHGYGAWMADTWVCHSVYDLFFERPDTLAERIEQSNWLQCVGYQAIFEEARRQWPHCSMALNWCFNEPWITAGNNSLIAWPNKPKPAYYAVANSLSAQLPSARVEKFLWNAGEVFSAQLWYLNDTMQITEDTVTACLTVNGKTQELLTWNTGSVNANGNKLGPTVNVVLPEKAEEKALILTLRTKNGKENSYKLMFTGCIEKEQTLTMNV